MRVSGFRGTTFIRPVPHGDGPQRVRARKSPPILRRGNGRARRSLGGKTARRCAASRPCSERPSVPLPSTRGSLRHPADPTLLFTAFGLYGLCYYITRPPSCQSVHSRRSASTGRRRAALIAGYTPNSTPSTTEKAVSPASIPTETVICAPPATCPRRRAPAPAECLPRCPSGTASPLRPGIRPGSARWKRRSPS